MSRKRRHPLAKERFLEGTRQKWMLLFLIFASGVAFMSAYYGIDPEPFMRFLTIACLAFVIGASASSVMKEYKRGNIEEKLLEQSQESGGEPYDPRFDDEN